jgi:hypothetical protein
MEQGSKRAGKRHVDTNGATGAMFGQPAKDEQRPVGFQMSP